MPHRFSGVHTPLLHPAAGLFPSHVASSHEYLFGPFYQFAGLEFFLDNLSLDHKFCVQDGTAA